MGCIVHGICSLGLCTYSLFMLASTQLSESMKMQTLADNPATVDFFLQLKYCRLLALVKMRMFKNAVDEWASSSLDQYPGLPFSLRLLGALLPSFTGNHPKAIDNVYAVLHWVRTSMKEDDPLFAARVRSTQLAVVSIMARQRDFLSAVQLLDTLCSTEPGDGALWSHLGLMCIELGDLNRAAAAFAVADPLVDTAHSCMNMGLLRFAQGDYEAALELFGRVIALGDAGLLAAATNNRACCLLFTRDLSGAVATLEAPLLSSRPQPFIDETLVFNLNTLTDLHNERPVEKKQQLARILTAHADDAFDHATVTLNSP